MINYNSICESLPGKVIQANSDNPPVLHVLIDSRKLIFTEQALFIAIKGAHNNSHNYLQDVYDAGVRNFIVEESNYHKAQIKGLVQANIYQTPYGIKALQSIAKLHRQQFNYPVIGITGSNGKTIVKEWLAHLLKDHVHIVRNPKSYNSQIGVPLSVLQMQDVHQLGIFEAGISEPQEMQVLQEIIQPTIGIFTLLGDAHDEGFASKQLKLQEKQLLFKNCEKVIYSAEQDNVHEFFSGLNQSHVEPKFPNSSLNQPCKKYISWSRIDPKSEFYIQTKIGVHSTQLTCHQTQIEIPFTDQALIWNACTCLTYLLLEGIDLTQILPKFSDLPVLDMRLQLKEAHQNCLLINDSYSADLGSLKIALEFMEQHAEGFEKTVILSDFLESGKSDEVLYETIANLLAAHQVHCFIGIGSAIGKHPHLFKTKQTYFYESTQSFLKQFELTDFHQQIILLKGARSFAFERIGKWLEKKTHQTIFEINLNALVHNLNVYRELLKPQVKVMAMVKAFSYGAGSYEIARILNFNRVDYLTVAYADEGVVLRKAGIKTPIMVMNPELHSFDVILQYNLEPEVYHFHILRSLLAAADGEEVGIHIELDSGMKRLGFDASEIDQLLQLLAANTHLKVRSVFTHLAASEDAQHDVFTRNQIAQFEKMSAHIQQQFAYPILRHCLNSGGIARFANAQFDMVRLGIGLYGVDPTTSNLPLQSIGSLKTVISQLRNIDQTESIGYGRKGHLVQTGKIAIVAIGYADGLDRKLSNGVGAMMVNGKLAPIVGNICMDMTMLDVSDIDCTEGDEVIVFGTSPSIIDMSNQIGTIPYEVLTGISQRVKRVYFYE
ncbi:MAG: bifunctional UDP-N-acetylmuramoyl-tripeptide:D-alanyl-D-alanine ligase/alanine racemase [bacterium]|nr:bifunctional UDP-N-acetylmuramoyl-tripeptide:D-alanyl-D-alanine ligase/alanine racemase [bacterium]